MMIAVSMVGTNVGGVNGIIEEITPDHPRDITKVVPAQPMGHVMPLGLGGIGSRPLIDSTMTTDMEVIVTLTIINVSNLVLNCKTCNKT